ncbi:DUF6232 family protein [Trinickia caryophylli]|uniref:Uncharacterized protein n=1 Tax=Trinickia caryophylli TaxID=28094 RepID=A0A1X7GDA3_TRICW|nr:DUF6232 family protein [Trinickia caryophylli]PMS10798.1 hypothetical protein C0Z17_18085 [Trinickia caryophylli]TRX13825.1 hypothetical protein FNF07_20875 [Trinickia caryophylli]WQE15416.1 DUF6232 family protein [Trinickia caryophylli]SMF67980.1 hypothetical protein SAMN06295900_11549 [Trinickia caryophylli]GLU33849.1 hypothetical protein Busp01_36910 [Trinickia caryophylli]
MENSFNERGVTITRNGLSAGGQLFALRDIQALRVVTVHKNKALPLVVALIGAATAATGGVLEMGSLLVIGVMLVVVGALAWYVQDITHRLMIRTATGEREALTSTDIEFVERVGQAVHDALARTQSV